jgi:hypothetical protein
VDLPGSGEGSLAGCCECGVEPSGSVATELVNDHRTVAAYPCITAPRGVR